MITPATTITRNTPAVRFHINLADRTESEAVERYRRQARLAADINAAIRRADAIRRLEEALAGFTKPAAKAS